ncbi:extracellular solute-binding protein [Lutibaculum baratangense]|uniref:ABC transporter, periplasmic substrate-binding protein n=1 Tax=Lutibaculum baratangense AMV1 TaxID=631454 RepID=V4RMS6_9HYPH|nr:extracellular solute-binding protein [Lutibaculum baratangense]ESR26584.1 ABC transporter, periplasmic substrate-binding protein [Lutibaculum baratangense AMV1]
MIRRTHHRAVRLLLPGLLAAAVTAAPELASASAEPQPSHGIAMHGDVKEPPDFTHFGYANPDAPKGGWIGISVVGSFDTLNPFTVTGQEARNLSGYVFQPLLARSLGEPFALYPLIAESVTMPEDRSWIEFTIDARARFSDGEPVTVDDVIASWRLLRDRGRPNHRSYYALVDSARATGERSVRFSFSPEAEREMPLIMGLMPVLPSHVYNVETFDKLGLSPPVGTGPYVVSNVARGRSITLTRQKDWWGNDLPATSGQYNFDTIRYEYFRDQETALEAFRKGIIDFREEEDPSRWALSYDFPAARRGEIVKEALPNGAPRGMSAFVFNTRRAPFGDIRVREGLSLLFPGAWVNRAYYRDLYERTDSFFDGSELSAEGRPATDHERELLAPWIDEVPQRVLEGDLGGQRRGADDRRALREALRLLKAGGFELRDGRLVNAETGERMSFEILVATREHERLALAFSRALDRAGIEARVRSVDSAQYQRRKQSYDFDVTHHFWFSSLSPGNEQRFYWGSAAADQPGTRNYMGVTSPGIDATIDALLAAHDRDDFVTAVRALDRLLVSGHYVVPLFHRPSHWVAYQERFAHPETPPLYGYALETWWDRTAEEDTKP